MSQYQAFVESSPEPALSGARDHQRHGPIFLQGTQQHQGAQGNEEHAERRNDILNVSQALEDIQQSICQLRAALHGSQAGSGTPYQQTSLGILTSIAHGISECLDLLRTMNSHDEAITPEEPTLRSVLPNIVPVLWREDATTGTHQVDCPAPGVSPFDGPGEVVATPSAHYASGPYEVHTEAVQLPQGASGYVHEPHADTSSHMYPYTQPCAPLPPSPELYRTQWINSPPVSPMASALFCHHPFHVHSPSTVPDSAVLLPLLQETVPSHTHEGTSATLHGGVGYQQEQLSFPLPGAGAGATTMAFPLHYDTPAGPRMALYRSHLPSQPFDVSPQAGARRAPAVAWPTSAAAAAAAAAVAVSELAAEMPSPPPASMDFGGRRRAAVGRPAMFARADSDSDSDSGDGARWASDAFEGATSP